MTEKTMRLIKAMRTRCAEQSDCNNCPKYDYCRIDGDQVMRNEAADLIESLAAELEQVTRERDVAVERLAEFAPCSECAHHRNNDGNCSGELYCKSHNTGFTWQWRGVKED